MIIAGEVNVGHPKFKRDGRADEKKRYSVELSVAAAVLLGSVDPIEENFQAVPFNYAYGDTSFLYDYVKFLGAKAKPLESFADRMMDSSEYVNQEIGFKIILSLGENASAPLLKKAKK